MEEEQHEDMQGTIRKGGDHANKILRKKLQMAKSGNNKVTCCCLVRRVELHTLFVDTLTVRTGFHAGSYSRLCKPVPKGRHM